MIAEVSRASAVTVTASTSKCFKMLFDATASKDIHSKLLYTFML